MLKPQGVAHFSIPVRDLARSIDFYRSVLGMKLLREVPPMGMAFMDCGGDCIVLVKVDSDISTAEVRNVHHAIRVPAGQFRESVDELVAAGVSILYEEDRREKVVDGPRAYFHDPDGNTLEIIDLAYYGGVDLNHGEATEPAGT